VRYTLLKLSSSLSSKLELSQVGFTAEGEIKGLDLALYNNAGNSLDLSSSIMDRALLHTDNSYRLGAVRAVGHCCFTHQASNTAFRGFGGPQVSLCRADLPCGWRCLCARLILSLCRLPLCLSVSIGPSVTPV